MCLNQVGLLLNLEKKDIVAVKSNQFRNRSYLPRTIGDAFTISRDWEAGYNQSNSTNEDKNFGFCPVEHFVKISSLPSIKRIDRPGDIEIGIGIEPLHKMIPRVARGNPLLQSRH